MTAPRTNTVTLALLGLMVLSGFAGLGYQIVWVRMLALGLGHEIHAVLAVVAAFFAGLAVGSWWLDSRIARSSRPELWYVGAEAVIAAWAIALIWLMPLGNAVIADLMGPEPGDLWRWAVAFGGPFLLLLPATVAMGATLPAADAVLAGLRHTSKGFGGIYAANTLGAVLGVVLSAYWILPAIGYSSALWIFAGANALCALAMLILVRGAPKRDTSPGASSPTPDARALLLLLVTGFLGIGVEVAGVRALSQLLENTVYSYASALAVFLLATSLGAALYHRWRGRTDPDFTSVAATLSTCCAFATALGGVSIFLVEDIYAALRQTAGHGTVGAVASEFICAALVFALPATAMGALFTHLALAARRGNGGIGTGLAVNTFGAATAPLIVGTLVIPLLGMINTVGILALTYVLIGISLSRAPRVAIGTLASMAAAAILMFGPFDRSLVTPPPGGKLVANVEGISSTASIVETAGGDRFLRVNGRFTMGGTSSYRLDRLQAHAALMQLPQPERALFLGVGTGATVAATAAHPDLIVDAVDLSPEVLQMIPQFPDVERDIVQAEHRIQLRVADARRAVRTAKDRFDLVLADTYHPARDGAGLLYTREHFAAIRAKLTDDGMFVQWLPLHQLDLATLKVIVATFVDVYPDARLFMGNFNLATPLLALYGRKDGALPDLNAIGAREIPIPLRSALTRVGLNTPFALFGGFIAGPKELRQWAKDAPVNVDDHPIVLFEAPRTVYEPLAPPIDRLLTLIGAMQRAPSDALALSGVPRGEELAARLGAYWRARDRFMQLGTRQIVTGDLSKDVATLAPQLIEILRISPDFAPAYDPVLSMARATASRDPRVARTLLMALRRAAPHRPEATALLAKLQ